MWIFKVLLLICSYINSVREIDFNQVKLPFNGHCGYEKNDINKHYIKYNDVKYYMEKKGHEKNAGVKYKSKNIILKTDLLYICGGFDGVNLAEFYFYEINGELILKEQKDGEIFVFIKNELQFTIKNIETCKGFDTKQKKANKLDWFGYMQAEFCFPSGLNLIGYWPDKLWYLNMTASNFFNYFYNEDTKRKVE